MRTINHYDKAYIVQPPMSRLWVWDRALRWFSLAYLILLFIDPLLQMTSLIAHSTFSSLLVFAVSWAWEGMLHPDYKSQNFLRLFDASNGVKKEGKL